MVSFPVERCPRCQGMAIRKGRLVVGTEGAGSAPISLQLEREEQFEGRSAAVQALYCYDCAEVTLYLPPLSRAGGAELE